MKSQNNKFGFNNTNVCDIARFSFEARSVVTGFSSMQTSTNVLLGQAPHPYCFLSLHRTTVSINTGCIPVNLVYYPHYYCY